MKGGGVSRIAFCHSDCSGSSRSSRRLSWVGCFCGLSLLLTRGRSREAPEMRAHLNRTICSDQTARTTRAPTRRIARHAPLGPPCAREQRHAAALAALRALGEHAADTPGIVTVTALAPPSESYHRPGPEPESALYLIRLLAAGSAPSAAASASAGPPLELFASCRSAARRAFRLLHLGNLSINRERKTNQKDQKDNATEGHHEHPAESADSDSTAS